MRHSLIAFILLLFSAPLLAMPCPNGQGILYKGDLLDKVLQQCGKPETIREYERTIPVAVRWTFYKKNIDLTSTKLKIFFHNNQIVNIEIQPSNVNSQNVASTGLCGPLIRQGNSMQAVESACGKPVLQEVLETKKFEYKELIYGRTPAQILIFREGQLIDFQ